MENLVISMPFSDIYRGRRVLVTGHTGFKGSWLCEWLLSLGAEVHGMALPPPTDPSLFDQLSLQQRLGHHSGDIRDPVWVQRKIHEISPAFIFHLAAQPLVRQSYDYPLQTYATNVMGTAHVLEAVRVIGHRCTIVAVTTDKCYENREWLHSYREVDAMGGHDPYSSSKAAAEILIAAYRRSFFSPPHCDGVYVASARAGNVIGGGDWAKDRIVPDCIRALKDQETIRVRNKFSTRPWQHVLEPLSGYLLLASRLHLAGENKTMQQLDALAGAFNFGPNSSSNRSVAALVQEVLLNWDGEWQDLSNPNAVHEATLLNLATEKAFHLLDWGPVWDFAETVEQTVSWYRQTLHGILTPIEAAQRQIHTYTEDAGKIGLPWALPRSQTA